MFPIFITLSQSLVGCPFVYEKYYRYKNYNDELLQIENKNWLFQVNRINIFTGLKKFTGIERIITYNLFQIARI